MNEPVEVARCDARYKADLLVGLLTDAGIPAVVHHAGSSGYGERAFWGAHCVMVPEHETAKAAEIVAGWWDREEGGQDG